MSSHPHVVDLFDVGVTADRHPYLIMELCDGSYADRMRGCPLGAIETREVGVKIADALADAHELGVLHRDVKPANILFSRFGEPALADFGLAVLAEARDASITLEVLTPAYAAPEMFRHGAPSPAVDVYALCATLYTVMNGRPPRWRDDQNPSLVTLMEMFAEPIPDLPGVPPAFTDLLRTGMANNPADRPSAGQLRDSLATMPLYPGAAPQQPGQPERSMPHPGWPARAPVSAPPSYGAPPPRSPGSGGVSGSGGGPDGSMPGVPLSELPTSELPGRPPARVRAGAGAGVDQDGTPTVPHRRRHKLLTWLFGG
jgi:serine/threonine protein kinase